MMPKQNNNIIYVVAIIAITILEIINLLIMKIDGNILSSVIGSIVFIATREYYKRYKFRKRG